MHSQNLYKSGFPKDFGSTFKGSIRSDDPLLHLPVHFLQDHFLSYCFQMILPDLLLQIHCLKIHCLKIHHLHFLHLQIRCLHSPLLSLTLPHYQVLILNFHSHLETVDLYLNHLVFQMGFEDHPELRTDPLTPHCPYLDFQVFRMACPYPDSPDFLLSRLVFLGASGSVGSLDGS